MENSTNAQFRNPSLTVSNKPIAQQSKDTRFLLDYRDYLLASSSLWPFGMEANVFLIQPCALKESVLLLILLEV